MRTKNWFLVALSSSLLSLGFHFYLGWEHYLLKFGLSEGKSSCNISSRWNCDAVALSDYSQLLGIPLAFWAATTHLVFLCFLIIGYFSLAQNSERVQRLSFVLAGFIALMSVVMGSISFAFLQTYCIFCTVTYLLSAVLFYATWKLSQPIRFSEYPTDFKSFFLEDKWLLGLLAIAPLGAWLIDAMLLQKYGLGEINRITIEKTQDWAISKEYSFDLSNGLTKGPKDAKMVIVEFADYLCPHCKAASPTLDAFASSREDVLFVFKVFPLDGVCNPEVKRSVDGVRCQLSYAVQCAESVAKKGWMAHDYVFERQAAWNPGSLNQDLDLMANKLNLPLDEFKSCMQSESTHQQIVKQAQEGAQAKIEGTPSIFINGRRVNGGQFLPVLQAVYSQIK